MFLNIQKGEVWLTVRDTPVLIISVDEHDGWGVFGEFIKGVDQVEPVCGVSTWDDDGKFSFDQDMNALYALKEKANPEDYPEYFL